MKVCLLYGQPEFLWLSSGGGFSATINSPLPKKYGSAGSTGLYLADTRRTNAGCHNGDSVLRVQKNASLPVF